MLHHSTDADSRRFPSTAFSTVASVFVILVGAFALVGWIFGLPQLKSVYGEITMKANAAITLVVAGASLFLLTRNHRFLQTAGQICAVLVALVGLLTFSEHVIGWNLRVDELLFTESPGALATTSPGRMGITSSSCFIMLGIALLLIYRRKAISLAQVLTMIAGLWALLAIVGYAYQAQELFMIARYTGIALHTAIAILGLSLGLLSVCRNEGLLSVVCDRGAAGIMIRRLALVGIIIPFLLGWLGLAGQRAGYLDPGLGMSLLVIAIIVVFLLALWRAAIQLRRIEQQRLSTEAGARRGEEHLRRQAALIDLSSESIFVWNFMGAIVDWNQGCEQLYGYSKQEAIGQVSHELLQTEFPVSREDFLSALERNRRWAGELRHHTRDGRVVIVDTRQQLLHSNDRELVLEANRNITERRRAEEALTQQRELLQVTLSSIGDAVIATDISGCVTFMNSVAQSLTGWNNDAIGRPLQDVFQVVNEQTRGEIENPALRAMREGAIVGLANHSLLISRDGREIPIDDSGAPIRDAAGNVFGAVLIFRDVTERRTAENAQALLADIVESSEDAIVGKSLNGIVRSWNIGAERLFGYQAEEIIGKSITLIVPADRLPEEQAILAKLRCGERIEHFETVRQTKDGRLIPISLTVSPIRNRHGEIIGASKIARDITEQKKVEREREIQLTIEQHLRNEAQAANRIKDEFLATISHELRTPLNAMLGWATMLKRGKLNEETIGRGIDAIERNAKAQAQLIEDLLDVSRIISGKMRLDIKPVMIMPIVKAAMDSVRPAAEAKEIQLDVTIDLAADGLRSDEVRLQQIIWNLLSNSIKFTPRGGHVEIKIGRVESMAEIAVSDNGIGLSEDFRPFVFDRFQQADPSITRKHGGLGLGLAITRHLVEMLGGTIAAESEGPGLGSTFRIRLPLAAVAQSRNADKRVSTPGGPEGVEPPSLAGARILAIDDADDTRDLLRVVLERYGADVMTAPSAREGLELMTGWKPDVLVCDIGMPEEDGYSLIRKIRALEAEEGGRTPAIALTGYVRIEDRMRALDAGFQMFVPKPVEALELVTLIDSLRRGGLE
jgi:PAS domain S-box-containing protein